MRGQIKSGMPMAWFRNHYRHAKCAIGWNMNWSCTCNDRCPVCDAEIEAHDSDDLTILVREKADEASRRWSVLVSPDSAEHSPDYAITWFLKRGRAEAFGVAEAERLGS